MYTAKIYIAILFALCILSCLAFDTDSAESELSNEIRDVPFPEMEFIDHRARCRRPSADVKVMTMRCSNSSSNPELAWAAWAGAWISGSRWSIHVTGHVIICARRSSAERMAKRFKTCIRRNLKRRCSCSGRSCAARVLRRCGGSVWVIEEE